MDVVYNTASAGMNDKSVFDRIVPGTTSAATSSRAA
jgi:hypothetical protein